MDGGWRRSGHGPPYSSYTVLDTIAYRAGLILSVSMTAFKKQVYQYSPSISETTVTLNIPMASFVWVLRNTATCWQQSAGWTLGLTPLSLSSCAVCPWVARVRFTPWPLGCRQTDFCYLTQYSTHAMYLSVPDGWAPDYQLSYFALWPTWRLYSGTSITATLTHWRLLRPCPSRR